MKETFFGCTNVVPSFVLKQPPEVLFKKDFLNILPWLAIFIKKDNLAQVFSCELLKIFLQSTSERLLHYIFLLFYSYSNHHL